MHQPFQALRKISEKSCPKSPTFENVFCIEKMKGMFSKEFGEEDAGMAYVNSSIRDRETKSRLGISEMEISDFAASVTKTNVYLEKKQKAAKKAIGKNLMKEISDAANAVISASAKTQEDAEEELEI